MNFYRQIGELILGTRLKRISERFLTEIARIYKSQNLPFEPSWFSIFYLLDQYQQMSIGEIAAKLDISQSGVSQMINVLLKKEMVQYVQNGHDKRVRTICFTWKGQELLQQVKPIWNSIKKSLQDMLNEQENSAYLLHALDEFEDAMEEKSIYLRVSEDLKNREIGNVNVVPYNSTFKQAYQNLLLNWFIDNDTIEIRDLDIVNAPEEFMGSGKGRIYIAVANNNLIGVVIAAFCSSAQADILVFTMEENWRRSQFGKKILDDIISDLYDSGKQEIRAILNRKRVWEVKLFKQAGFRLNALNKISLQENFVNIELILNLPQNPKK